MKHALTALAVVLATGCGDPKGLVVEGTLLPGDDCTFSADGPFVQSPPVMDVASGFTLRLPVRITNEGTKGITADRLDFRWECNEDAFAADVGALVVPAYSLSVPFCLSALAETGAPYVGYDLVQATSPRVAPGTSGVAMVEVVPPRLGEGLDELFSLARLADRCLISNPLGDPSTPECAAFAAAVPGGEGTGGDAITLAPFARFDGRYLDEVLSAREGSVPPTQGAAYPLTIQAILYGMNDDGEQVESNQLELAVDVCRNCGMLQDDLRQPRAGFECYH
ncbi:MAG: hypothetical protein KC933_31155 [Myxococcales bacterium]|nr:hypothetical protein [Myxococcales bacterium]